MIEKAQWIWSSDSDNRAYNQTVEYRRVVHSRRPIKATISITADTTYRLLVNGVVVADGPCRSWPFSYQYDVVDLTEHVVDGDNEILVIVRYFGCGTSSQIPQQGALIAQMVMEHADGSCDVIATDDSWSARRAVKWTDNVPKMALGLGPMEIIDARREPGAWQPARVLFAWDQGPWKNLHPRDVELLTRKPVEPALLHGARIVSPTWQSANFSPVRFLYPGLREVAGFTCMASIAATVIVNEDAKERQVSILPYPPGEGPEVFVNGSPGVSDNFVLKPGANLLLAFMEPWGHHNKEQGICFQTSGKPILQSPSKATDTNPWDYVVLPELLFHEQDAPPTQFDPPARTAHRQRVDVEYQRIKRDVMDVAAFHSHLASHVRHDLKGVAPLDNPHWQFESREIVRDNINLSTPSAFTLPLTVKPDPSGDVELCFDLGDQVVGYFEIDVEAAEGTVLDLFAAEYIDAAGRVQHTWACRNGFRHVCRAGRNHFSSLIRRSGRYLFLTIRNQEEPVVVHSLRVVESTYPVKAVGSFNCSDDSTVRLWDTSVRTLQLCMEDVFTDCPLYEQTLWVGDARNEALFAEAVYGHLDIVYRCIRLAAEGLQLHPIVPSHVPTSNNECMLPAWAFLWGRMVWDVYWYTGDKDKLREHWPWVLANINGMQRLRDERGLFSMAAWNMFDWTNIDAAHKTVTHNSMLLVGCIDAAVRCANVLAESAEAERLLLWKTELVQAINALWDEGKESYVDSVHDDGSLSRETCVHTNFLAVLHGIVPQHNMARAIANMVDPPESMTRIGSPFAIQYLYEALELCGMEERILDLMNVNYQPMLEAGATTLWEQFPNGSGFNPEGFPTRSHCHAWSSAPIYFFNRIVLGIRQVEEGGRRYDITPTVSRHTWAEGASATINGPVRVRWDRADGELHIQATAPEGVLIAYQPNPSHNGLNVFFNGESISSGIAPKLSASGDR
jgi:alpha-L-rhamnosidase